MHTALFLVAAVVLAYLLGSVPFAMVSSRLFGLADPRSYGSKNPGATNVLRSGNMKAAIVTLLGDLAKGWLAVFLAQTYGPRFGLGSGAVTLVALAVFFGHLFPIFLNFRGGKGVATAAGVLLALDPLLGLATLSALVAAATAPLIAFFLWGRDPLLAAVAIIAMALVAKHWANLQRLMAGTEPKIGARKKA